MAAGLSDVLTSEQMHDKPFKHGSQDFWYLNEFLMQHHTTEARRDSVAR